MKDRRRGIFGWLTRRLNMTEIFSVLTSLGLFYAELDNRKPLDEALEEALETPVASYARWPALLGIITVVLLAAEILTGMLLALYYLPTPAAAHASVRTLLRDVEFGWFVHQIHFWGAQLLIAVLIVQLTRFFVHRVFDPPRELIWVFAALLLLVCLHADLTGRFLPWTTQAYWSSVRALDVLKTVPIYGALVSFVLGGGESYGSELTLIRFYVLHVGVLPLLGLALVYLHFSSIRRVGLGQALPQTVITAAQALRLHVANLCIVLTLVFGLLVTVAVLFPVTFLGRADPYTTVPGVPPPWYLLAPFGLLELNAGVVPQWLIGSVLFLAYLMFIIVPFVDKSGSYGRGRAVSFLLAALVLAAWLALTIHGARVA